jgi:anti-sigma28 factor (negative regulator of flagellin synthesis)
MVINKVGDIQNIIEPKKTKPALTKDSVSRSDSAYISIEGKQAAELARSLQMVNDSPDTRVEKIRDIKDKINNGTYNFDDKDIINKVAEKLTAVLLKE